MEEEGVRNNEEFRRYQDYLDYLQGSIYQGTESDTGASVKLEKIIKWQYWLDFGDYSDYADKPKTKLEFVVE